MALKDLICYFIAGGVKAKNMRQHHLCVLFEELICNSNDGLEYVIKSS